MSIFDKFFKNKNDTKCPRCLGKGNVDLNDIERLNKQLFWKPGKCAYCNGKRKVSSEMLSTISEDEVYLTTDLPKKERELFLKNNSTSKIVAKEYAQNLELFVDEIYKLHSENKLTEKQISEYIDSEKLDYIIKGDTIDYVKKVIKIKKSEK